MKKVMGMIHSFEHCEHFVAPVLPRLFDSDDKTPIAVVRQKSLSQVKIVQHLSDWNSGILHAVVVVEIL